MTYVFSSTKKNLNFTKKPNKICCGWWKHYVNSNMIRQNRMQFKKLHSHLLLGFLSSLFPQVFTLKPCMDLSSHPYVKNSPPNSSSLLWSPLWLVRVIKRLVSILLRSPVTSSLLGPDIFLGTIQTPSSKCCTHTKQRAKPYLTL